MPGRFISFEGGEGVGKTTQIALLDFRLKQLDISTLCTREPGGTKEAEKIRDLLLQDGENLLPMTHVLLHFAARFEHVERKIKPALADNMWVISDRFTDSTYAYQVFGMGVSTMKVGPIHRAACKMLPDLTIFLDLPTRDGFKRKESELDSYEKRDISFHARVKLGYVARSVLHKNRIATVDAEGTPDEVHDRVWKVVKGRFKEIE